VIYGPMNKVGQVGGEASAGRLRELVSKKKGGDLLQKRMWTLLYRVHRTLGNAGGFEYSVFVYCS
jgi:hypothetical protein